MKDSKKKKLDKKIFKLIKKYKITRAAFLWVDDKEEKGSWLVRGRNDEEADALYGRIELFWIEHFLD